MLLLSKKTEHNVFKVSLIFGMRSFRHSCLRGWKVPSKPLPRLGHLVLHKSVDMVLSPMLAGGHLEHISDAQQRLLSIPVCHHL